MTIIPGVLWETSVYIGIVLRLTLSIFAEDLPSKLLLISFDADSYQHHIKAKPAEMHNFVKPIL